MAKGMRETDSKQGLVILTGGYSQRMGRDKAFLPWQGQSLLRSMVDKARRAGYRDIIISFGPKGDCAEVPEWVKLAVDIQVVHDYKRCGPLGGLAAAFALGQSDHYAVVAVDMPFVDFEPLLAADNSLTDQVDALLMRGSKGREEPLYAVYKRSLLGSILAAIKSSDWSLRAWLSTISYKTFDLASNSMAVTNVNTPNEYKLATMRALNEARKIPIISIVSASRKSGKTSLVVKLTQALTARGYRIGLVKSDGHGFTMDREGSDTDQAMKAGAQAVAIAGPHEYALRVRTAEQASLYELTQGFEGLDLVLLESRSQGVAPMIEVYIPGHTEGRIGHEKDIVAHVDMTDFDGQALEELVEGIVIPCFA